MKITKIANDHLNGKSDSSKIHADLQDLRVTSLTRIAFATLPPTPALMGFSYRDLTI